MGGETWAIVGVVVGAVLGGGAQVLADQLNRRETRRQRARELQVSAYTDLLSCVHDCNQAGALMQLLKASDDVPEMVLNRALSASQRTWTAASHISLVGPSDTAMAAYLLADRVTDHLMLSSDSGEDAPDVSDERAAFLKLAKRDLGLD